MLYVFENNIKNTIGEKTLYSRKQTSLVQSTSREHNFKAKNNKNLIEKLQNNLKFF